MKVSEELTDRASTFGLLLDDISLVRIIYFNNEIYGLNVFPLKNPISCIKSPRSLL